MPEDPAIDQQLLAAWTHNAEPWTRAVREGRIESRAAATDAAVVEAVLDGLPPGGRVLDLGCGEGWLVRALTVLGVDAHGIDASRPLIDAARAEGGGTFEPLDYDTAAERPSTLGGPYDAAVFNFSLLSDRVVPVLGAARSRLDAGGRVIVQTVHPLAVGGAYREGWREESFGAMGGGAFRPAPWFFRTFGSWVRALDAAGLRLADAHEPRHPKTGDPLSLLLVAEPAA